MARSSFVLLAALVCAFVMLFNTAEAASLESRRRRYHGIGTWFIPSTEGGPIGACGDYNEDDDMIVAMNKHQYGKMSKVSDVCGRYVVIKYKGKSVRAKVTDACPECAYGSLDLTQKVYRKLEKDLKVGVLDITWRFD